MPKKPKRPCSSPGCPELTDGRFCPEHAKKEASRYEKYQRDPETRKRYGRAWKRIRDRYIAAHPLCEECKRQGKLTPAAEVHHILPLARGGTHDESNLMALCTPFPHPSLQLHNPLHPYPCSVELSVSDGHQPLYL
jgi:5-methylcytosine-specific restriction protein A